MGKETVYEIIFKLIEPTEQDGFVLDAEVVTVYEKDDIHNVIKEEMSGVRFSDYEVFEVEKTYKRIEI